MITACKSYITDSGYETIWTQEQNAVLKKLDDCIKLNEEYQVNTGILWHDFLTKSCSLCSIDLKSKVRFMMERLSSVIPCIINWLHWHVLTWIWETHLTWYQQADVTGRGMGAGRSLSHWIIESADYLQPIKMLILSTELFSVLTQSGWSFSLCIAWCSQQRWHCIMCNAFWTAFLSW